MKFARGRCGSSKITTEPGSCGDIEFYLVEVKFDALDDEAERHYFKQLPTSFVLKPEEVDKLGMQHDAFSTKSKEFQRLVNDLQENPL